MAKATPATRAMAAAGIDFVLHEYAYDPGGVAIGRKAAEALGVDPQRVLKTLMAKAGETVVCVLVPSDRDISLRKLAALFQAKEAALLPPAVAERLTGYHVGGISPFGQKKKVPVVVVRDALTKPRVFVNAGRRGLQAELAPQALVSALGATPADLS